MKVKGKNSDIQKLLPTGPTIILEIFCKFTIVIFRLRFVFGYQPFL